jgi:serine/threonine-protein kinase RsbW/sigma-B regulation protein RsbU (phosphoserine phosphatase)
MDALPDLALSVEKALVHLPDCIFPVNLCLEELLTNIIRHGLGGAADHHIGISIRESASWLEVELRDDAPPFNPFSMEAPAHVSADMDERPIGGLGIHLIKNLMDTYYTEHDGLSNVTVLRKAIVAMDRAPSEIKQTQREPLMNFEISQKQIDGTVVLSLGGKLDSSTANYFEGELLPLFKAGPCRAVLDLSALEYISSAGLRVVLMAAKRAKQSDGRLVLCSLLPEVQAVFEIGGFLKIMPTHPSLDEALLHLRG